MIFSWLYPQLMKICCFIICWTMTFLAWMLIHPFWYLQNRQDKLVIDRSNCYRCLVDYNALPLANIHLVIGSVCLNITSANVMSSTFIEWVGDGDFVIGFFTGYGKYTLSPREKIWLFRSKPLASICNMWRMIFLSIELSSLCHRSFPTHSFRIYFLAGLLGCVHFVTCNTRECFQLF